MLNIHEISWIFPSPFEKIHLLILVFCNLHVERCCIATSCIISSLHWSAWENDMHVKSSCQYVLKYWKYSTEKLHSCHWLCWQLKNRGQPFMNHIDEILWEWDCLCALLTSTQNWQKKHPNSSVWIQIWLVSCVVSNSYQASENVPMVLQRFVKSAKIWVRKIGTKNRYICLLSSKLVFI
jgi:hypothetical protein